MGVRMEVAETLGLGDFDVFGRADSDALREEKPLRGKNATRGLKRMLVAGRRVQSLAPYT